MSPPARRRFFHTFFATEAAGGVVLLAAAVAALAVANSPWAAGYAAFWQTRIAVGPEAHPLTLTARHWVNDGLMAGFFLLVGLEIKRELLVGELSNRRQAALPFAAALGGVLVPALLYLAAAPADAQPRVGRAHRHRHRFRARRAGAGGTRRAGRPEGVPGGAGHRRRPGRGARHRLRLHRRRRFGAAR